MHRTKGGRFASKSAKLADELDEYRTKFLAARAAARAATPAAASATTAPATTAPAMDEIDEASFGDEFDAPQSAASQSPVQQSTALQSPVQQSTALQSPVQQNAVLHSAVHVEQGDYVDDDEAIDGDLDLIKDNEEFQQELALYMQTVAPTNNEFAQDGKPLIEVSNLQAAIMLAKVRDDTGPRGRRFARLVAYILQDKVDYRSLNDLMNAEAKHLGKEPINPNLPQMAKTYLDRFISNFKRVTFTMQSGEYTLVHHGVFRSVEESVLNRIVSNGYSKAIPIVHAAPCSAVSELSQTPLFKAATEFHQSSKIIMLSVFSDSASRNTSNGDSIHPIDIEIEYDRSLRGENFARNRVCVGFFPATKEYSITNRDGKPIAYRKIPLLHRTIFKRGIQASIEGHVLDQLKQMVSKRYNLPCGLGICSFAVFQIKSDLPETLAWSSAIGCPTCFEEATLSITRESFRTFAKSGRAHEDGIGMYEWSIVSPAGEGWEIVAVPDIMHCLDNYLGHLIRMVALILCCPFLDRIRMANGKVYTIEIRGHNSLRFVNIDNLEELQANDLEEEQDDGVVHQPRVHLHAASIVPADRVTTRETTAKKSSTWADFVTFAEDIGGEQTGLLLGNGGSSGMMDRSFGLRGLVLAIRTLRASGSSNVASSTLQQIEDLIVGTYSIVTYLMDASCGFCLASMREDYAKVLQLWLQVSKRAAIGVIPVTVHAFFHFPALIERFGAPMIYAIYWHESAHVAKKEFLLRLSNMVLGQTGSDYLYQLMKKEAREDVLIFLASHNNIIRRKFGFALHCELQVSKLAQHLIKFPSDCDLALRDSLSELHELFGAGLEIDCGFLGQQVHAKAVLSVSCKAGWNVVSDQMIGSLGSLLDIGQYRALAIAPEGELYDLTRQGMLASIHGCKLDVCLSCAPIEFQSTLFFNTNAVTHDIFIIPLGFTQQNGNDYVLGVEMECDEPNQVLSIVTLQQPCVVKMYRVQRIRAQCMLAQYKVGGNTVTVVLRRLRLILK